MRRHHDFGLLRVDFAPFVALVRKAHARVKQNRKYTGEPYEVHPAEVAAYATTVYADYVQDVPYHVFVAVAWGHDLFEDTDVTLTEISNSLRFWDERDVNLVIAGIRYLTDPDLPELNREGRMALQAVNLREAPAWVQGIKLCDNYCNIKSIAIHDPGFARVYLKDKDQQFGEWIKRHNLARILVEGLVTQVSATLRAQPDCPECESGILVTRNKELACIIDGKIQYFPNVDGQHCTRCAYVILDPQNLGQQARRIRLAAKTNPHFVFQKPVCPESS